MRGVSALVARGEDSEVRLQSMATRQETPSEKFELEEVNR
jgi:hypothetical protein